MNTPCPHCQSQIKIYQETLATGTSPLRSIALALVTLAFVSPVLFATETVVSDVLNRSKPVSALTFHPAATTFLSGKGRGIPTAGEKAGRLGIALIFAQNNYWTDNRWSAPGYNVKSGTLRDAEGRLPSVDAYEVSPPSLASDFSFFASGSDLFFEFPTVDDWTVYSVIGKSDTPPAGKTAIRFKEHLVIEEARIPRSGVTVGGFTKVPGTNLHALTRPKIYFFLPSSVVVRPDSLVAAGVTAARIAETELGRITALRIVVSPVGTPENSGTTGRNPGDTYGAKPGLTCFPEADGGISVVWQSTADNQLLLTRVDASLLHSTVPLPRSLGRSSNAARDSQGNLFYVTYAAGTNPQVMLVKVAPDGRELAARAQDTAPAALNIAGMSDYWDSVRLSCAGDRLCVTYGRGMDNGHQGSIIVTYATSDISLVRNHGQNSSHSFDSRVVPDGGDFINLSLGDNYPRGLALNKVRPASSTGKVIFTYKTRHYPDGLASNDNRTYTEIGDLAAAPEGYGAIFASEAGTDNTLATGAINEARNVGYLLVARNFDSIPQSEYIVPPSMILTTGADSPLFGFYNFGGGYVRQHYRGVRWLTQYTDLQTENATRPKMLAMPDGKRLILWEKWTPSSHVSTHGMRIDALGNPQTAAIDLGGLRLSDGDSAVLAGHRVHLVTGNGKELEWGIIETDKPLPRNIPVLIQTIDRAAGMVAVTIASIPGKRYRLETSTTLAPDDWHEVPGTLVHADSESLLLSSPFNPAEPRQFWRVAETE